ncbi:Lrp/AsnC family transcriptional regulator [Arthrobacter sp. KK5.5]|uniref:Lrp/AsnC family transcriptional regulator n=1 Tax=Arthrobacter sp. KK5.5 TaxID=3373084 RepID=UPI003EE6B449
MHALDDTDLRLLDALALDPKATVLSLAQQLGISRNTVQARTLRLENRGAFLPFERRVNPTALGYPITSFVHIHVQQRLLGDIVSSLSEIPEVVEAHGLTGSADILARVVARDAEDLFRVNGTILHIDGVDRADTSISMAELIPHRMRPLLATEATPRSA